MIYRIYRISYPIVPESSQKGFTINNIEPIFHCDTKLLALGPSKVCIGDTDMVISKNTKICLTPNEKHKICISPNANPQRESV